MAKFGENVRALLAQAPLRPRAPVVGLDPGFRTGCKLAAVDARGEVLGVGVVYLPEVSRSESRAKSEKKPCSIIGEMSKMSAIRESSPMSCIRWSL